MKTGIIFDEPFAEYLSSSCVGSHRLEDLRPRPLLYYRKWVARNIAARAETPALHFGRLFHCLALEGEDAFRARYIAIPADAPEDLRRYRNAAKKSPTTAFSINWWDEFDVLRGSRELADRSDIELAWQMAGAIRAKPSAVKLLSRGKPEVTFRHQLKSFAVQARVDWFDADDAAGPMLVNVKTIESLDDFDKQYHDFGYYKGDAFYRLVVAKVLGIDAFRPQCVNLVVEKSEPFECAIRVPDAEALAIGTDEVMADLRLLEECFSSGKWPGEPDEFHPVSLPEWKVKRAMKEAA